MSNAVDIDIIEYNVVGDTKKEFGIIFSDNYATTIRRCYPSMDEILKQFPTKQSLVDYLSDLSEFVGSDYVLSENHAKVLETYDPCMNPFVKFFTVVNVYGYPE